MARKFDVLDASSHMEFQKIYEAINVCFGTSYTGWMKACWPDSRGGGGSFRAWFPKLAETKNGQLVSASFDCINTISDDWNEVVFDDLKDRNSDMTDKFRGLDLIFAKEPNGGPYIFRGVFIRDEEKSRPSHDVSKRIGTRVRLLGDEVHSIEILDDFRNASQSGINTPLAPKDIQTDGTIKKYTCPNCDYVFSAAPRCPECGQLLKLED